MIFRVAARIDTAAIRRDYPLADIAARHGVALRPRGAGRWIGACPFHDDHDPSLAIYADDPRDEHFHYFGCGVHGDVIRFVELAERLPFRAAVAALTGGAAPPRLDVDAPWTPSSSPPGGPAGIRDPAGRACLAVAVDLYQRRLLDDPAALAYCRARGLDAATLARCRVGYAAGGDLAAALRRRGLPLAAAARAGLLDRRGEERLAGRLVVPEIREGGPLWLIGRTLGEDAPLRYLGLPGRKPLLGWAEARGRRAIVVTEGVVDRLVLSGWGFPAVALAGTHARPEIVGALARFPRIHLLLDADPAGRAASAALRAALGARAVPIPLPAGVKDVAELAPRPDGRAILARAIAEGTARPPVTPAA